MKTRPLVALYIIFFLAGMGLLWFIVVGPITTKNVKQMLAAQRTNIVISLTTTPDRIDKIKNTLDSLVNQSIKANKIFLNVPYTYKRNGTKYIIPPWLSDYRDIVINRSDDFGPITKLIPTLQQDLPPDTIIITVDDDTWYPQHVVRDLVKYSLQHPQAAVTSFNLAASLDSEYQVNKLTIRYKHGSQTTLVAGVVGTAYRRSFFKPEFIDFATQLPAQCQRNDDIVISMYLIHNNIPIEQTLENSFNPLIQALTFKYLSYASESDALSFNNDHLTNYAQCLAQVANSKYKQYQQDYLLKAYNLDKYYGQKGVWDMVMNMINNRT